MSSLVPIFDFSNIKSFVISNGILIAIAGYTIAHASSDLIKVVVANLIMPTIYKGFVKTLLKAISPAAFAYASRLFVGSKSFDFEEVLKQIIAWVLICAMAYVLIVYLLERIFVKNAVDQEAQRAAKHLA